MPSVIAKQNEKVAVTRLKKTYSILSQALLSAINEYGTPDSWRFYTYEPSDDTAETSESVTRYYVTNFTKQLKIAKECGYKSEGCFISSGYKKLSGSAERDFENLNNRYYKIILSDGTAIAIEGYSPYTSCSTGRNCGEIWVDINGNKAPNVVAKDLFLFTYTNTKIRPYGYDTTNQALSSSGCNKNSSGYYCTAWVLAHENMDYLHCDDLSWVGKTKYK